MLLTYRVTTRHLQADLLGDDDPIVTRLVTTYYLALDGLRQGQLEPGLDTKVAHMHTHTHTHMHLHRTCNMHMHMHVHMRGVQPKPAPPPQACTPTPTPTRAPTPEQVHPEWMRGRSKRTDLTFRESPEASAVGYLFAR